MKNTIAFILVFSIFTFLFPEVIIYVSFKIKREYIAENLCVQKDVKGSTCKGCCQLEKKINEQKEQKKDLPNVENNKQNITFCNQNSTINFSIQTNASLVFVSYKNQYNLLIRKGIFHPPKEVI